MSSAASLRINLDNIPKELLARLQNYGVTVPESRESKEDVEVQKCFENIKNYDNLKSPKCVLSPRSTSSDDDVFRFSPKPKIQYVTLPEDEPSHDSHDGTAPPSPKSVREMCNMYGDNSDWIMVERLKPRSPPISPDTTSRKYGNIFNFVPKQNTNSNTIDRPPKRSFSQSSIHDIERTPTKQTMESNYHRLSPSFERTPVKEHINMPETAYQRLSPSTPVKQMALSQERSNGIKIFSRNGSEESIINDRVPSPFVRDPIDSNKLSPEQQSKLLEELSRRGVKKQLTFESHHYGNEDQYLAVRDTFVSPRTCRNQRMGIENGYQDRCYTDYDSDFLIGQLLSRLNKIKRRASDDYCCDCDSERVVKRMRTERSSCQMSSPYTPRKTDTESETFTNKIKQQEAEVRTDNCTCAVMEKQFLQMAENAYKNVRRKDSSPDGFEQFRKELVATNEVLKDSLNVLRNMKDMCEHKFMTS